MKKHVFKLLIILSTLILGTGLQSCSKDDDSSNSTKDFNKLDGIWKINYQDDDDEEVIPRFYVIEGTKITDKIYKFSNGVYSLEGETEFTITDVENSSFKFRISDAEYIAQIKRFEDMLKETSNADKKKDINESIEMFKKTGKTKIEFNYTLKGDIINAEINSFFSGKEITDIVTLKKVDKLPETK